MQPASTEHSIITDTEALSVFCARLAKAPFVTVDTEFMLVDALRKTRRIGLELQVRPVDRDKLRDIVDSEQSRDDVHFVVGHCHAAARGDGALRPPRDGSRPHRRAGCCAGG